jgi:autotransporter-associated beta strand protein
VTFARRITGSGNVEKVDTNAIVLTSDNNDYAGTTTITAGILSVGNGGTTGALGGTGDITLGATGTLQFNRQGTVNVSRNIAGTGATANAVQYGTSVDLNGAVFNVSGHNTYSGDTTVQEGTVVLSTDDGLGDTSGETVILGGSGNYATVALTGGITVAENFTIGPRGAGAIVASGYVPHIGNDRHGVIGGRQRLYDPLRGNGGRRFADHLGECQRFPNRFSQPMAARARRGSRDGRPHRQLVKRLVRGRRRLDLLQQRQYLHRHDPDIRR